MTVHQPEFLVEALAGFGLQLGAPVALVQLGETDGGQRLDRSTPVAPVEVRKRVAQVFGQVEGGAPFSDLQGVGEGVRAAPEAMGHFLGRSQIKSCVGTALLVRAVQRRPIPDGHHDVLKSMPLGSVIVDVPCSHHGDSEPIGEPAEAPVPVAVPPLFVVLKLDEKATRAEGSVQAPSQELGNGRAVFQRPRQRASLAPGEGNEALRTCEEGREGKGGLPAFTFEMRLTQEPAEVGVTSRGFGQEGHVAAPGHRVAIGIATRAAAQAAPCIAG